MPPPYDHIYNKTASSDSYEVHGDTVVSSLYRLRKHSSSPQPFQQQARRSTEPFRRRVHSPYSAVRRPVNANYNSDQHPDNQTVETAQTNKVAFRQKRKKALCVSPSKYMYAYLTCYGFGQIGINYKGQERELRGCVNDAWNISEFLKCRSTPHFLSITHITWSHSVLELCPGGHHGTDG